ncbi:aminopeptidase P N-terminal domain-containing protein [Flavobacteriaceae bacterium]|jgi:Xaa-Pro aminopeptidase|nr:M24 family metallopeptidase [Flavobacteriaceae bacterium]MBT4313320.1 M24 family metallopeptidase [Flavobacteriaceae bacterium]MBT5445844.1 M24 family metallopeptidase [Flavobacteriaceae bacterium]MBT5694475.1 M24 family metallopeptidase [Flavobacteriaceae bacterium]MDA7819415.1 aminopeptidase P N-terminal domain-containing protein [Flavobacteriaceae bacterium]|tara:strand:- start:345 stop:1982 length:1638 start_codon:yes stop_codon:yes gene_type:complete
MLISRNLTRVYVPIICFLGLLFSPLSIAAQKSELSSEFHKKQRQQLREKLPNNSVAVYFSAPVRNRANDVDFEYHPDPNFYYLTGWNEPHAVLIVYSSPQKDLEGTYFEKLYVRERDANNEMWNGRQLGVEGARKMGLDRVASKKDFSTEQNDFSRFDSVLMFDFKNDVRDNKNDSSDLFDLQKHFKNVINYPDNFDADRYRLYQRIRSAVESEVIPLKKRIYYMMERDSSLKDDPVIIDFMRVGEGTVLTDLKKQSAFLLKDYNFDINQLGSFMASLRENKTEEEILLIKKAVRISTQGQLEVMKAIHPEMTEREVQGIHQLVFKKYGAAHEGYPSIVGAGDNACVLHYITNDKTDLKNQLILMDLGAEYKGYTADVTRTIPVSGTFTPEQKALYQIVYDAQTAGINAAVAGASFTAISEATYEVVKTGLLELGLIQESKEYRRYLPHGIAHHIGLDVHDPGLYENLAPNMVITVEPGIYVPEGSPCDPKWWNIGIRIEDDILITAEGPVNLSKDAPRSWQEIEKVMLEKSALDDFILPPLTID